MVKDGGVTPLLKGVRIEGAGEQVLLPAASTLVLRSGRRSVACCPKYRLFAATFSALVTASDDAILPLCAGVGGNAEGAGRGAEGESQGAAPQRCCT